MRRISIDQASRTGDHVGASVVSGHCSAATRPALECTWHKRPATPKGRGFARSHDAWESLVVTLHETHEGSLCALYVHCAPQVHHCASMGVFTLLLCFTFLSFTYSSLRMASCTCRNIAERLCANGVVTHRVPPLVA